MDSITAQQQKINNAIESLSKDEDIIEQVRIIESSFKTTRDNYGSYLSILTPFASDKVMLFIFSSALKKAGGNTNGIQSAIKILIG